MGYDGYITIGTKIDTSGIDSGMSRINQTVKTQGAQLNNTMAKTFSLLKNTIIGVGIGAVLYGITKQLGAAVSRVDTLNNFANVMGNLGISADNANKSIEYLSDKLTGLPTTLDDAALSVQRLTSANGNINASTEMFLAMNNAILAGGASMQIQKSAIEQLSQAYTKGKPDMMEWRTAMMAMPAQMKQIATVMGYTSADALGEALRSGAVSMNEFYATMVRMNREGIGGFKSLEEQARNATGGIQTSIANLKTAISRGLATIIDAIGQSNIADFFNAIAKAINTASLYVAAFIKLVITAINAVGALFGKKTLINTNKTKKNVSGATTSMNQLGASADTASGNVGKITNNAKKLKKELKQLASFDEMNVLSDKTNSGTGGSGGSGGTGGGGGTANLGDLSGLDFETEAQNKADKIEEIFKKMKDTLSELFGNVDFKPLIDSLGKVWKAAKPLLELTWDNLKWIWFNVLVPLGKWTIEDAFPAWLGIVEGLLKIIKPLAEAFSKAAKDVYREVIKPLAERYGRAFVDVLERVSSALGPLGTWMKNHKPLLEDIYKIIIYTNPFIVLLTIIEKVTRALEWLNDMLYEYSGANKTVEGTQRRVNDLTRRAKHAYDDYRNAVREVRDAKRELKDIMDEEKISSEKLSEIIKQGDEDYSKLSDSQQKVYDKYMDLKDAEGRAKDSAKKYKDVKDKLTQASLDHKLALAKESGKYDEYKEAVMDAYDKGKIKSGEARTAIGKAMSGMSEDSQQTFVKDIPDDIKDGIDPKNYETPWEKFKSKWKKSFLNKIPTKIALTVLFPPLGPLLAAWDIIMGKLKKNSTINVKVKSSGSGGKGASGSGSGGGFRGAKGAIFYPNKLPRLAAGGIVNMPGSGVPYNGAIIGERGAEAVVPLTDSQQMALLGEAIGKYITINANITNTMNGRVISRELQQIQNESNFMANR